jgi:hypothetical protein
MDSASETTALTNLPPELQAKLDRDRSRGNNQYPTIPVIRLANKDMTQAPEGEYFIETKVKDGESEIQKLGKNPELIVLYQTRTYSYYDTDAKQLVAWTSDIHGYGDNNVVLYLKTDGKVSIDFDGTFNDFKKYRTKFDVIDPVTEKKKESLLKFKNVLYVLFEGKVCKMFVSNASAVGVLPDGRPSFDKAQSRSMQYFTDAQWNHQQALYDVAVTMSSKLVKKQEANQPVDPEVIYAQVPKPFYIMQFESIRTLEPSELATAVEASMKAEAAIRTIDEMRKNSTLTEMHKATGEQIAEAFGEDQSAVIDA